MKKYILGTLLAVFGTATFGQSTQVDTKKLIARDWIIYQGDTLATVEIRGDTLIITRGAQIDTTYGSKWTETSGTIHTITTTNNVANGTFTVDPSVTYSAAFGNGNVLDTNQQRGQHVTHSQTFGITNKAYNLYSQASGASSIADGQISTARGNTTMCSANDAAAEGNRTVAGRRYYEVTVHGVGSSTGVTNKAYVVIPAGYGDVRAFFPNALVPADSIVPRYGAGATADSKGNIYPSGMTAATYNGDGTVNVENDLEWALHSYMVVKGTGETEIAFYRILKSCHHAANGDTIFYNSATEAYSDIEAAYSSYAPTVPVKGYEAGNGQHAEGFKTSTWGYGTHAEGLFTKAWANHAHAGGAYSKATGTNSFVHGYSSTVSGANGIGLGYTVTATDTGAVSIGYLNDATNDYSFAAGGYDNTASGDYSFAGGTSSIASGQEGFAFGNTNKATGRGAVSIGGYVSTSSGDASYTIGQYDTATANYSSAVGTYAKATRVGQHSMAVGQRAASGDSQTWEQVGKQACAGVGWHQLNVLTGIEDNKSYYVKVMISGSQYAGDGGSRGNTWAYEFQFSVSREGATYYVNGTPIRTLVGRTAGLTGDGLTTGVYVYWGGAAGGVAYLAFAGELDCTYQVVWRTTVVEIGF